MLYGPRLQRTQFDKRVDGVWQTQNGRLVRSQPFTDRLIEMWQ